MADTVIGTELCPACGRVAWLVRLLSGAAYCHSAWGGDGCFGEQFIRVETAEAVRRIREQEPRLVTQAHP